jgi:hypothetical protein
MASKLLLTMESDKQQQQPPLAPAAASHHIAGAAKEEQHQHGKTQQRLQQLPLCHSCTLLHPLLQLQQAPAQLK